MLPDTQLQKKTYFDTTNSDHYNVAELENETAKNGQSKQKECIREVGWLQKSNVPIGTMGKYIEGCHQGWYN